MTPGPSGKIFVSWGPGCEGEAEIVAWEPGKKTAWKDSMALVEWTLKARGGKTIVRLVQSAFPGKEDSENEWFDSTNHGWGSLPVSIKVALERDRGIPRQLAWPHASSGIARAGIP